MNCLKDYSLFPEPCSTQIQRYNALDNLIKKIQAQWDKNYEDLFPEKPLISIVAEQTDQYVTENKIIHVLRDIAFFPRIEVRTYSKETKEVIASISDRGYFWRISQFRFKKGGKRINLRTAEDVNRAAQIILPSLQIHEDDLPSSS